MAAALVTVAGVLASCGAGIDEPLDGASTPRATREPRPTLAPGATDIPADAGKDDSARLTGAGATFPTPLYTRWFSDYQSDVARDVQVNYQPIGSGGGVKQIMERTVDFGASDTPMSDAELAKAPGILHIPMTMGAVAITYNLEGLDRPIRLDGETLARIYLGDVTAWDDPAIASQNSGVTLPDDEIVVVHRSDGSGTSFVFTDYLSKVSRSWDNRVGTSKNPSWPEGLGGEGNAGVTQQVKQNKNSIGYVELVYANQNGLPKAELKNRSGEYIAPAAAATSLAGEGVAMPDDYRVSIVDSPASGAYPIASFTYILLYEEQGDQAKGTALTHLLWWAIHDGQATTSELDYAPLPDSVVAMVEATLVRDVTHNGTPILTAGGG